MALEACSEGPSREVACLALTCDPHILGGLRGLGEERQ